MHESRIPLDQRRRTPHASANQDEIRHHAQQHNLADVRTHDPLPQYKRILRTNHYLYDAHIVPIRYRKSEDGGAGVVDIAYFEKNIRPLLISKCYECHSAETQEPQGGLTLDTREGMQLGGESGPAVVPGNVAASLLASAVAKTVAPVARASCTAAEPTPPAAA